MTSFHRLSGIKTIVTIGAALSMTAGLALAGDVSSDQIVHALQPRPVTRGLSAGPQADPTAKAREISFVQTLRNRKTRSLSLGEREQIAEIASTKPKIDLDIQFDYNSANITATSMPSVQALGEALTDAKLKGSTFSRRSHRRGRRSGLQSGPLRAPRRYHQALFDRKIRHRRHRPCCRRLRQDQAEGSERADGPDQPSRSGRQHGHQDRVAVTAATRPPAAMRRAVFRLKSSSCKSSAD
jgi:hypothetical protein